MQMPRTAGLSLAVLLLGTATGCVSDSQGAVQVTTSFYQAAIQGDCATALTYVSPSFVATGQAQSCATVFRGYRIDDIVAEPRAADNPQYVRAELTTPAGLSSVQAVALVRGPHGFLVDTISGDT